MARATVDPNENDTLLVSGTVYDSDSAVATPNSLYWMLVDNNQTVIDSGAFTTPAGSFQLTLTGSEQLGIDSGDLQAKVERHLIIHGNYNSTYGNNLALNQPLSFDIINLKFVRS